MKKGKGIKPDREAQPRKGGKGTPTKGMKDCMPKVKPVRKAAGRGR